MNTALSIHRSHLRKYKWSDQLAYLAWHRWAEMMTKRGFVQEKCPHCNLYTIWKKEQL